MGLLVGRGGVGKTRVLTALCEALEGADSPVEVRILAQASDIDQMAFRQLPRLGKLLVIVDDAHSPTLPIGRIIAGIKDAHPAANVLLSLRPYGVPHSRRELARVHTHHHEAVHVEIGDLEFDAAVSLACEVLDEQVQGYAPRLAAAARDCPLLIVTGAALINRGSLDPRNFEGDEQLHVVLTDRLADALTIDSPGEGPRQSLLCALAAFQPVRLDEPAVRTSLEALTGLPFDVVASHLTALEQAGVLLRHGTAVRVVPDLLGDGLLVKAARHPGSGVATGYLSKALEAAQGSALVHLVVNAGRVDWQDRGVSASRLIEPVWRWITDCFQAAQPRERVEVLEVVAKVAFFQPRRSLELVAWAMSNPSEPVTVDIGFGMDRTYGDTDVRQALPPVLQSIAYHPEFLPEAAALLWALGCDAPRTTRQHFDHPLQVLGKLASFSRYGPTDYQRILATQVERWLEREPAGPTEHQPLSILAPLLAAEGHDEVWSAPDTLTFRPYVLLPVQEVLELREKALKLAFMELGNARLERAAAAVTLIGAAMSLPRGSFGLKVSTDAHQAWIPHIAGVIRRLGEPIVDQSLPAAILVAVREELQWLGQYGPEDLRGPARQVLTSIPKSLDNELARALHGGPADPPDSSDAPDWLQAQADLFASVTDILTTWPDDTVITRMSALLADERKVFRRNDGAARSFILELVSQRPSLGEALCEHTRSAPADPLASLVSAALIAMRRVAGDRAVRWGRVLADNGNVMLVREVAHAFGLQRQSPDLLDGEAELLRDLAAHHDGIVHAAALGAARQISGRHKDLAIELLTASPRDEIGINELALALSGRPAGSLSWSDLNEQQQTVFIERLTTCPSLDSYEIQRFLACLAHTDPMEIVGLLEARVEACEDSVALGYRALPYAWHVTPPFRDSEAFPGLLRQIGDWLTASPDSPWKSHLGADLFALVAGTYDTHVTSLIDAYLDDPEPARLKALATILRKASRELLWNRDLVHRCLRTADRHGDQLLGTMQNALHAAVITGMRSGTLGEPYPEDIEQYEKATALAAECETGSVEEMFYRTLVESAERRIKHASHDLPPDNRAW